MAVLVAVVVVGVVLPLMALVVDLGVTRMLSQRFRGGADAAALGAAAKMRLTPDPVQAASEARLLVQENLPAPGGGWNGAWASCTGRNPLPTVVGPGSCISFDLLRRQVRVTVPQQSVPTVFAGVLGAHPPAASATTTASWGADSTPSPAPVCALCVLGNYDGGQRVVVVSQGDAAVGGAISGTRPSVPAGTLTVGRPVADPFASSLPALRTQTPNGQSVYGQTSGLAFGACQPGIYQDVSFCTSFTRGTYFVTGRPDLTLPVSLNADASGVVLFFTCSASGRSSVVAHACPSGFPPRFIGTGTGSRMITAPGGGANLALVFDAGLVRNERLSGTGRLTINGSVYGPGIILRDSLSTTSSAVVNGGRVLVGAVSFRGPNTATPLLQITAPPAAPQLAPDGPARLITTS